MIENKIKNQLMKNYRLNLKVKNKKCCKSKKVG